MLYVVAVVPQGTLVIVSGFTEGFHEVWAQSGQAGSMRTNDIITRIDGQVGGGGEALVHGW